MSKTAKTELTMQKERRVAHFQKSVAELAELEVKHAKAHAQMLRQVILSSDWSKLIMLPSDWSKDTNNLSSHLKGAADNQDGELRRSSQDQT